MKSVSLAVVAVVCAVALAEQRVELIDARELSGRVSAISDKGLVLKTKDEQKTIPLADIAGIRYANATDKPGSVAVMTHYGDLLKAKSVSFEGKTLTFKSDLIQAGTLRLRDLKGIYLTDGKTSAEQLQQRLEEMKISAGARDVLVVSTEDKKDWVNVQGVAKKMDAKEVLFNYQDKDRIMKRSRVVALLFAVLGKNGRPSGGSVQLTDGSVLNFEKISLSGGKLKLTGPGLGDMSVATSAVAAVRFQSDRLTRLTKLKPVSVKEHGFLDTKFPHRMHKSAGGKPLTLDGRGYQQGLGLHSFAELKYKLDKAYDQLVVRVGIDDSVRPAGNATVRFLDGEGRELLARKVTGKDKSEILRIGLEGVKELVIRVEFGQDKLDVGDHVDLVNPNLIK